MSETSIAGSQISTRAEGRAAGKALRKRLPRAGLATVTTTGRDPFAVLDRQNESRLQELLPLRTERMSANPFAYYRGTAGVMAADLAREPNTGILVPSSGDAHIGNFGFFASPQRTLVFDLNDFDEAAWAPWEWDLKRLVASVVLCARDARGQEVAEKAARKCVKAYARALRANVDEDPLQRYYTHFHMTSRRDGLDVESHRALKQAIASAEKRTAARAARKLTTRGDNGELRFIEKNPVMTHDDPEIGKVSDVEFPRYVESANVDIQLLLHQYRLRDVVRRVVGVGSVGTRCYLALLSTGDDEPLLLQLKRAGQSVLVEYGGVQQPVDIQRQIREGGEGARVVGVQRVLQAFSDPFLGHFTGSCDDYYVRQFQDMKGSIDTDVIDDEGYTEYAVACAVTLARAHAQAPAAAQVAGYVGKGKQLATALVDWAGAYADLVVQDYRAFTARAQQQKAEGAQRNAG